MSKRKEKTRKLVRSADESMGELMWKRMMLSLQWKIEGTMDSESVMVTTKVVITEWTDEDLSDAILDSDWIIHTVRPRFRGSERELQYVDLFLVNVEI